MRVQTQGTFQDVTAFDGFGSSPDGLGMTVRTIGDLPPPVRGFARLGQVLGATVTTPDQNGNQVVLSEPGPGMRAFKVLYGIAGIAGAAVGAYHGYKRNDSVGWAIVWSLLGSVAPVVVIPVAYAQGIGKHKQGR